MTNRMMTPGRRQHEMSRRGGKERSASTTVAIAAATQRRNHPTMPAEEPPASEPASSTGDDAVGSSKSATNAPSSGSGCHPAAERDEEGADDDDPHELIPRFVETQAEMFRTAMLEIRSGRKRSCWAWFVLPTPPFVVNGVERGSRTNRAFALRTRDQAVAYLSLPTTRGVNLRDNYVAVANAVRRQLLRGNSLDVLLGFDAPRAVSSFRYFAEIGRSVDDERVYTACEQVLELLENKRRRRPTSLGHAQSL